MRVFEANRFSDGNALFPAKIILGDDDLTLKIPGLFDGKEKTLVYRQISSIEINGGMLSFCEIIIKTARSGKIVAKGFSQSTAKEIKAAIEKRIIDSKSGSSKSTKTDNRSFAEINAEIDAALIDSKNTLDEIYNDEIDQIRKFRSLMKKLDDNTIDKAELEELDLYARITKAGTPSSVLKMELEEKGIMFEDLIESGLSLSAFSKQHLQKQGGKLGKEFNDSEKSSGKYLIYMLLFIVVTVVIAYFLKQNETSNANKAKEIQIELETKALEVNLLYKSRKYKKALELTKELVHPDHIIFDSKSQLLTTEYYDSYWDKYRDSVRTRILKRIN
jgi:hypothetical protein